MESAKGLPAVGSELKSLANTRSKVMNSNRGSTTYESIILEKQDRALFLKNEIESIQKSLRDKKIAEGPSHESNSALPFLGLAFLGLVLGILSSVLI